jgi:ketosteroid isomerase-like protein
MDHAGLTASDEAEIKALNRRLADALRAGDINAVMSAYAPDDSLVVFDAVPPLQYVGAEACRKNWENALAFFSGPVEYEMSGLHVETDGSLGFSRRIDHVVLTDKDGHKLSRITNVYRKVDGKCLIAHEHASMPVDLITGKADLFSK